MMAKFGKDSLEKIATLDKRLQVVLRKAISITDFKVIEGARSIERQQQLFKDGKSKLDGINKKGKHNYSPSLAVDIAPYPIDWNDTKRFFFLAGVITTIAKSEGIDIVWGGDWDADGDYADQTFNDYPHFQIGK